MIPWATAFALTQLVEVPVWLRAQAEDERGWTQRLVIAFAASAITHPVVWWGFPELPHLWGCVASIRCWRQQVVLAESFAVVVEAGWMGWWGVRRAWAWSLGANALSLAVGLLLWWVRS